MLGLLLGKNAPDVSLDALVKFVTSTPERPQKFAMILSGEAKQLLAMIATNDVRYRGASLRFGLSMRHEGKPPARASNGRLAILAATYLSSA